MGTAPTSRNKVRVHTESEGGAEGQAARTLWTALRGGRCRRLDTVSSAAVCSDS
jgi:hypothetical protein